MKGKSCSRCGYLFYFLKKKKKKSPFKPHYKKGYGLISSYQDKTRWDYFYWLIYTYSIHFRYLEKTK